MYTENEERKIIIKNYSQIVHDHKCPMQYKKRKQKPKKLTQFETKKKISK